MKCGSCRGEHETVADVRACYAQTGKSGTFPKQVTKRTRVPARFAGTMTEKQESYLRALLEQTGTEADEEVIKEQTFESASTWISNLIALRKEISRKDAAAGQALPADIVGAEVPQGLYTVVWPESGERITLRFKVPPHSQRWKGIQLVAFLSGPNNEFDYTRCANRTDTGYRLWSRYRADGKVANAIRALIGDETAQEAAGMVYALESGNCRRCGRTLTVPASIHRGLGPECASILAGR